MASSPERYPPKLFIEKIDKNAFVPERQTDGSVGYDLASVENCTVKAHGKALVSIGIKMAIPEGHYGRIAPRSSLAWKNFIDVGAGVIDPDYRGEVKVVLYNFSDSDFEVKYGDRIAQLIIEKCSTPYVFVDTLPETSRKGGFGSTN